MKNRLIIKNIGCLATPLGMTAKAGEDQGKIHFLKNAYVIAEDGIITQVGEGMPDMSYFDIDEGGDAEDCGDGSLTVLDAGGKLLTPGLVDAHTHLVFGGWRQHEMEQKLKGATYLEILASGGGILSTVRSTRAATQEELVERTIDALNEMLSQGITTCEGKSGYGLDMETELKQLEVMKKANELGPVEVVPTFMGAHALPEDYKDNRDGYIDFLCSQVLPEVAKRGLAEFCDIFCEEGVFTAEESIKILSKGKDLGLIPKIHTDEICDIGGTGAAANVKAISAEHLIKCTPEGIKNLKEGEVIACLLPCTSLYLNATFAPARDMIEAGIPVAIATDFNPGSCPCNNIQLAMTMGCLKYRMTPEEVLTAVTLNAAAAVNRADRIGTIEVGKQADMVLWDSSDLNYIFYRMGSNLASVIIKKGRVYE